MLAFAFVLVAIARGGTEASLFELSWQLCVFTIEFQILTCHLDDSWSLLLFIDDFFFSTTTISSCRQAPKRMVDHYLHVDISMSKLCSFT